MKCPKCNQEINDTAKFCPKCGANIQEEEKRKKEIEEKKHLEELRKQEELKREEERIEAEKEQAIKQAKEEGIELEIIDKEPEKEVVQAPAEKKEFKIKQQPQIENKKEKKKKIRLKKNIFQILFEKILFIIIVAILTIGGVYYCYKQAILPEFAQKTVGDFEEKLQNVIKLYKEVEENKKDNQENKTSEEAKEEKKETWEVEPSIVANDIKDLTDEVSIIVKDNKEGLIDNKTGHILLETKYTAIYNLEYYETDKTEADKIKGIVIKDNEKYYSVDSKYQPAKEVITIVPVEGDTYYYDHHDSVVYSSNNTAMMATKITPIAGKKQLKICTDIDIITTEGIEAKSAVLPEKFIIDFEKSKLTTKGYCDLSKGELVIDCNYDEAAEFSEGYASVKEDGKAGIINEDGKAVIDLKYDETRSVHNGLTFVKKDGKWGIMKISL